MASPLPVSSRVRFGAFELDAAAGKLFKHGIPIKLQPQPLRVLLLLTGRRTSSDSGGDSEMSLG